MEKIKAAVVGYGNIGRYVLDAQERQAALAKLAASGN